MKEKSIVSMEEFKEISNRYNLGNIVGEPRLEERGQANYNYTLTTNKGVYQIRVGFDKKRYPKKDLEYKATDTLSKSNFPYNVPYFLENNQGERSTTLEGKVFEVYKRLPGEVQQFSNEDQYRQLARALAETHKHLKDTSYK